MTWLGIDIGGANVKLSDGAEYARCRPFPMWQRPSDLASELRHAIAESPVSDHLAVTMTGELADCFATKTEGVQHILAAVEEACGGRHTRVYLTDGRFVTPTAARRVPLLAAASNWRALADFARRFLGDLESESSMEVAAPSLLIDIGSTTTDVIPISRDAVLAVGKTDTQRMVAGELLYSGVVRTPVCAVVQSVPYRGRECSVAQELFATMRDVYLLVGKLPEAPADSETADGRPATKAFAKARLGRVLCADETEFHHKDAATLAEHVAHEQASRLVQTIEKLTADWTARPATVICSGTGEFVARRALKRLSWDSNVVSLQSELGAASSSAATAHALAVLAGSRDGSSP
jgi:probable H4MPT-linked C1 transfer pathway protein